MGPWETLVARARAVLAAYLPMRTRHPVRLRTTAGDSLVEIASDLPPPLGEMYSDVLRQQGIPSLLRDEGAGRGVLGGALLSVRLLVPAEHAARAQALLAPASEGSDGSDQRGEDGAER
jgi:hypothetical protein